MWEGWITPVTGRLELENDLRQGSTLTSQAKGCLGSDTRNPGFEPPGKVENNPPYSVHAAFLLDLGSLKHKCDFSGCSCQIF